MSVIIPDRVNKIEAHSFNGCINLSKVHLPANVQSIHQWAFRDCVSLEHIVFPDGIKKIDTEAFQNCSGLVELVIPESVEELHSAAFKGCSGLNRIVIKGNNTQIVDEYQWEPLYSLRNRQYVQLPFQTGFDAAQGLRIIGIPGSPAESYANQYGIVFERLE